MKNLSILFLCVAILTGCSHRIVRSGYEGKRTNAGNCEVPITHALLHSDSIQLLGKITLGESGFSVSCSEADAVEILRGEACALNADFVHIVEEKRPDAWSTCYRCKAEFYRYLNPELKPLNSEYYAVNRVDNRVTEDRKRNTWTLVLSIAAGFAVGFLIF